MAHGKKLQKLQSAAAIYKSLIKLSSNTKVQALVGRPIPLTPNAEVDALLSALIKKNGASTGVITDSAGIIRSIVGSKHEILTSYLGTNITTLMGSDFVSTLLSGVGGNTRLLYDNMASTYRTGFGLSAPANAVRLAGGAGANAVAAAAVTIVAILLPL